VLHVVEGGGRPLRDGSSHSHGADHPYVSDPRRAAAPQPGELRTSCVGKALQTGLRVYDDACHPSGRGLHPTQASSSRSPLPTLDAA
jgi:hypothetical protein